MHTISLASIADATGLPVRRLRYALDHRLLPGAERASRGHRVTRTFTGLEGLGIACAAAMLHGGLRRPLVRQCIAALAEPAGDSGGVGTIPLERIRRAHERAVIEVVAGTHWRLTIGAAQPSRWALLGRRPGQAPSELTAVFRLDVGSLRDAIRARLGGA